MRSVAIILLIALSCLALAEGTSVRCERPCTREFDPICGYWKQRDGTSVCTFSNKCAFENQKCRGQEWIVAHWGSCKDATRDCDALLRRMP
nr:turripeptide Ici9.2 [Drosophila bipectinata]